MFKSRKSIYIPAAAVMCAVIISSCGGEKDQKGGRSLSAEELKTAEYPLKTDDTLTLWMRHHVGAQVSGFPDYSKYPRLAEMEKQTGIKLDITYADNGQEEEEFNMLIASGDLPDMIYYDWMNITGGVDEAIRSGYITALNDLLADYAPNYRDFLNKKPEYAKMARTDSGNYYMFNGYPEKDQDDVNAVDRTVTCGFVLRKDWLDELGLEAPETIDEWHYVLTEIKQKKGIEGPLVLNFSDEYAYQDLIGAFGTIPGFYQEDGKVVYGRVQPQYRSFLEEMHKWYREGLLDEAVMSTSDDIATKKMIDGSSGACFSWVGAGIEKWLDEGKKLNPEYDLIGVKPPTLNKGETSKFGNYFLAFNHMGVAISAASDKKELATKFMDYGYSDKGAILCNYGIEGVSYEMKDGVPTYKMPPEGMTRTDFLTLNSFVTGSWPYKVLTNENEYFYSLPQQFQAVDEFKKTEYYNYIMPPITHTVDEAEEVSRLERLTSDYANEMMKKFILGKEPLDNFDAYVERLKQLGIDRLTELKQNALQRYNRR